MTQPTKYPLWDANQTAISDPGISREADGWSAPAGVPEKPPYQVFNHWQNNVYLWLKYLNEQGIAEWDTTITYDISAYVIATDGKLYKALISQSGNTPVSDATNWNPVGDLVNTLVSTDTTRGLTAAQGKVLKDLVVPATTSTQGTVELSTTAENEAGTSDLVVPTSKGIREAFNATGTAPVYAIRAWANLDGTSASPITPGASGNISAATTSADGLFTFTFTTNMQDTNYTVIIGCDSFGSNGVAVGGIRVSAPSGTITLKTTSQFQILVRKTVSDANLDPKDLNIIVLR